MKSFLTSTLALLALPLCAQTSSTTTASTTTTTTTPAIPASMMSSPLFATLSEAEKTQLNDDRTKVMAGNPDLQKEEMDLMQKGLAMQGTELTDADKKAFQDQIKAHAEKVRTAMIKDDPAIEPVIKKVEAQGAKLRAQYEAAH